MDFSPAPISCRSVNITPVASLDRINYLVIDAHHSKRGSLLLGM